MDLNTALMESITSMSEYFVAANTRTSFTDMAESGSLSSLTGHSTPTNSSNIQHHNNQSNLNQQFSSNATQLVQKNLNGPNQINHQMQLHHNQQHHHQQHQQNHHPHQEHSNNSSSIHSNCIQNNHYHNHSYSPSNGCGSSGNSAGTHSRLSQPIRTQIPIHCCIEQLDACADMHGYNSPLNDTDLFITTNGTSTSSTQAANQQHLNHGQPYLHQSKLALESVTNCDGPSIGLTSTANSRGLFNENESNNNDDVDSIDHLRSSNTDSPLSIPLQPPTAMQITSNNIQQNSICGSSNNRQTSYDSHNFHSCIEKYAIVTSNVLYIDLVRTVLLHLGYSAMDLINAKATIQIKNWKPLALDQVTEDKRATVGEVLGDISTFVTLRIRLYSSVTQLPTEWTETMIRQVVLALTQTMSQLTLSKLCNISQPLISSIVRGGKKLGRRKCAEFGQWYMNYIKSSEARPSTMFCEGGGARLVFDKSREIPQLKDWFANNSKPSDDLLEEYSKILNQHALRKDRPQVSAKALKNWWKNERQKLGIRQRDIRGRPKLKRID